MTRGNEARSRLLPDGCTPPHDVFSFRCASSFPCCLDVASFAFLLFHNGTTKTQHTPTPPRSPRSSFPCRFRIFPFAPHTTRSGESTQQTTTPTAAATTSVGTDLVPRAPAKPRPVRTTARERWTQEHGSPGVQDNSTEEPSRCRPLKPENTNAVTFRVPDSLVSLHEGS